MNEKLKKKSINNKLNQFDKFRFCIELLFFRIIILLCLLLFLLTKKTFDVIKNLRYHAINYSIYDYLNEHIVN